MSVDQPVVDRIQKSPKMPLTFRLFDAVPWRAPATGAVLGLALIVFLVALEALSGRPQALLAGKTPTEVGCPHLLGDYRIAIVGAILLAYAVTARYILSRWTYGAALVLNARRFRDAEALAISNWWGLLPGVVGALICFAVAVDISEREVEWTSEYWILPHIFNWLWCIPFGWVGGRLIYSIMVDAVLVSRAARRVEIKDLEEAAPLDAAMSHGMRSALLGLMFLGIVSVHFIDPGLDIKVLVFLVVMMMVGTLISALPVLGVAEPYYQRRDEKLRALRNELDVEEGQMLANSPDYEPGRISDIVSLERRLNDWHIDFFRTSNLVRISVYALIGLVSWLGAAAVSVLVESFFGL